MCNTTCYIDNIKGGYTFEKYPVALPYKDGDNMLNVSSGQWNQSDMHDRNMAMVSQNEDQNWVILLICTIKHINYASPNQISSYNLWIIIVYMINHVYRGIIATLMQ